MVLAHTRQAGAASAPIPSCPVHTGHCGHVPWELFFFSLFNLAAMEARATAPVSVSGQSGPG